MQYCPTIPLIIIWIRFGAFSLISCAESPVTAHIHGSDESKSSPSQLSISQSGVKKVRVASWNLKLLHRNIHSGEVKRSHSDYNRLKKYVDRLDADIVAFQEVDGRQAVQRIFDSDRYRFHLSSRCNVQRVGFAFKKGLTVTPNPDYRSLDVGGLRYGSDITLHIDNIDIRILNVHLKARCQRMPIDSPTNACKKLKRQLPHLESWIDERARDAIPAIIVGDFNRESLGNRHDSFWMELIAGDPPGSALISANKGQLSKCWNGTFPHFIDHILLNQIASPLLIPGSFIEHLYDPIDFPHQDQLSDHCPISIELSIYKKYTGSVNHPVNRLMRQPRETCSKGSGICRKTGSYQTKGLIKGNLNSKGRKIYHLPRCRDYKKVKIDESKGERWFESEEAAQLAGWKRAGNCP